MQTEISSLYYEMNCVCITMDEWYRLMKGERKCSYRQLISRRKSCRPCVMNLPFNFTILSGGGMPADKSCKNRFAWKCLVHEYKINR